MDREEPRFRSGNGSFELDGCMRLSPDEPTTREYYIPPCFRPWRLPGQGPKQREYNNNPGKPASPSSLPPSSSFRINQCKAGPIKLQPPTKQPVIRTIDYYYAGLSTHEPCSDKVTTLDRWTAKSITEFRPPLLLILASDNEPQTLPLRHLCVKRATDDSPGSGATNVETIHP